MVSFSDLWEIMERPTSPLMGSGEDSEILTVVRAGKDLRKEEETPFWDDFITLCSNSRGLAELLGVPSEKVMSWPAKIQEYVEKLQDHDAEDPNVSDEDEMLPTGDNGALTVDPTNVDPQMGAM